MAVSTGAALLAGGLAASTAYGANRQKKAAEAAANAQTQAAEQGIGFQREALQSFNERTEPFRQLGVGVLPQLTQQAGMGQSPLFSALQDDVTRRVFANQAAQGRTGGTETAVALANALAPLQIQQQQQQFANLYDLARLGSNVAAGQGTAGLSTAGNLANLAGNIGQAQSQGQIGKANAINQGLGGLASLAGFGLAGGFGGGGGGSGLGGGLMSPSTLSNTWYA
jgi:hypothetical protein